MGLFAAGVVFLALLLASYSRRGTWIALGSIALSTAVIFGCLLLATSRDPGEVRARLAWIATRLPPVDKDTVARLAASLERAPAASQPGPRPTNPQPMQAAAITGWLDAKPDAKPTSQHPVAWQLDKSDAPVPVTSPFGFSISGTNVENEALEDVHAVLKPDATEREIALALDVEGGPFEDGTVIPPKLPFNLFSAGPYADDGAQTGGAILTFRYVQAGQRKSSILYLTPAMVSRLANR
jgi:hypothetical protein